MKQEIEIQELIAASPLFSGLPDAYVQKLNDICERQQLSRGKWIFSEGDAGNGFYLVESGRVKIYKVSPGGKEQILHIFGRGEPFGEVPVFAGQSFPAHAIALEKTRLLFFPRQAFIHLIEQYPAMALNMLAVLSQRLRQFTTMIDALSLKEVPGRLAAYLLYLSEAHDNTETLELDITKSQLASLLGTIPETLSRMLSRISSQGMVELHGSRIVITDRSALEMLASLGKMDI
ncbi:MAG: Crp/Fnr family transcriptional regulator [Deltaproteobacteria bacterium]|nr:MAG: Crp/Fnr family transcriptional regulator [Deltaproteobacteria bacterium]